MRSSEPGNYKSHPESDRLMRGLECHLQLVRCLMPHLKSAAVGHRYLARPRLQPRDIYVSPKCFLSHSSRRSEIHVTPEALYRTAYIVLPPRATSSAPQWYFRGSMSTHLAPPLRSFVSTPRVACIRSTSSDGIKPPTLAPTGEVTPHKL